MIEEEAPTATENRKAGKPAGQRFEARLKKYLESLGYTVDKARARIIWIRSGGAMRPISGPNDFLGCADLIGVHPERSYTVFIQAHTGTSPGARQKKMEAVKWNLAVQRVQLWLKEDAIRGGVRVLELMAHGTNERPATWRESFFRIKNGEQPVGETV